MKAEQIQLHARVLSSLLFRRGEVSIVTEIPETAERIRERRAVTYALSKYEGRQLAEELIAWLEEPDDAEKPGAP